MKINHLSEVYLIVFFTLLMYAGPGSISNKATVTTFSDVSWGRTALSSGNTN